MRATALRLGISPTLLRGGISRHEIRAFKVGLHSIYVDAGDADRWLASRELRDGTPGGAP